MFFHSQAGQEKDAALHVQISLHLGWDEGPERLHACISKHYDAALETLLAINCDGNVHCAKDSIDLSWHGTSADMTLLPGRGLACLIENS